MMARRGVKLAGVLLLMLAGSTSCKQEVVKEPEPPISAQNSQSAPRALPDWHAKTVITTSAIAINNIAQYTALGHLPYANPNAPQGGELSMMATGTFNSLNPFIDVGVPVAGTFYLYDTLMTGSLDETNVLYPQLAEKLTYDPNDGSWVIYHIHPQARFWDGTPVRADDVKATFETILASGLMSWRIFLAGIEHIQALDDQRVLFYFADDAPKNMYANVGLMPVFAKKDLHRFNQVSLEPLMGSGAYRLGSLDPARAITYVKDPNYWGKEVMANRGRFNFQTIKFVYFQDETLAQEAFLAGQFNFYAVYDDKVWATFLPNKAQSNTTLIIKRTLPNNNPATMHGLVMNLRRPLFTDKRVRQALNLAFDWAWINEHLLYGEQVRLESFFYGSPLMATGKPSPKEQQILQSLPLNADELSALTGVPALPVSDGDGFNRVNLLKARRLLLESGFVYRDGVLVDKEGNRAEFDIIIDDDKYQALLLAYQRQLTRLGFSVRIRRMDKASFLTKKRHFDYDMIIDRFMQGNAPGAEQAYLWGSASAKEVGSQNTIGIQSQALDRVIDKLTHAKDRQEVILYAKVLDRLLLAGEYMIAWGSPSANKVLYYNHISPPPILPASAIGLDYWHIVRQP